MIADLGAGKRGVLVIDMEGGAGAFSQELRLATALHRDEPPRRLVNAMTYGEQAVIAHDNGFVRPKGGGDPLPFRRFVNQTGVVVKQGVILIKGARILRDWIEQTAQGGPAFAVERV